MVFLDELLYNSWMYTSDASGLGLCFGLAATTLGTRMLLVPIMTYSQMIGYKMKLLAPDTDDHTNAMKRYQK